MTGPIREMIAMKYGKVRNRRRWYDRRAFRREALRMIAEGADR